MKKHALTLISVLLIAGFVLAGCGPAASPTSAPTGAPTTAATEAPTTAATEAPTGAATEAPTAAPTELYEPPAECEAGNTCITVWGLWEGAYLDAVNQAFDDYEAAHPGVVIDTSRPKDLNNALKVAIPAGEGPDIIENANDVIGAFALAGNIVALDDYGIDKAFLDSTYEPAAVNGVIYQDLIWGLPETQEGIALVYNKDLVTDEYLPAVPTDFADVLAKAQKFYEDKGFPLFCNQGFAGADAYHIAPVFFGFGVPTYVDDQGNVYLDTPEGQAAMDWLLQIKPFMDQAPSDATCRAEMKEGKVGAQWGGPWLLADFDAAGINYGILPMGSPFVGIRNVMLTQNAVDRGSTDVAMDIMKYFASADVQKTLALANKTVPAVTAALQDPEVQAEPALAGFGAALNQGSPMANSPYASAQWGPVGDAVGAIWNGTQTPAEALAAAQAAIEDAIAQMQ